MSEAAACWREQSLPDGSLLSMDPARLDFDFIHGGLSRSYWSPGIHRSVVERAARHSLCHGLYRPDGAQIGYCRVITDQATFAWLADVFVHESARGAGLGVALVAFAVDNPDLAGLRRWMLGTADAQTLYGRFGFAALPHPERIMLRPGPVTGIA